MGKIVHLNYGHGGKDPGGTGNGMQEKNEVLAIGKKTAKILRDHKVDVRETRTTDVYIALKTIADKANAEGADIFVSFHTNAQNGVANGVEVFSYPGSAKGMELSRDLLNQLVADKLFKTNRGNKTANFAVLRYTKMPAALLELGFIDHTEDAKVIKNNKDGIALSVAKGILKNIGVEYMGDKKDVQAHWGEKPFKELNDGGIKIHEKRFDDPITRAEVFSIASQLLKKKMN